MLQFWVLVSKFYPRSLLVVGISSFCLAEKVVVIRTTVIVGAQRLYLGLQF